MGFKGFRKFSNGKLKERELLATCYAFFEQLFSDLHPGNALNKLKERGEWETQFPKISSANDHNALKWIEKIVRIPFTPAMAKDFQQELGLCVVNALDPGMKKELSQEKQELKMPHWEAIASIIRANIIFYKNDKESFKVEIKDAILLQPLTISLDNGYSGIYYKQEQAAILAEGTYTFKNLRPKIT